MPNPCKIRGVLYPSQRAAARALGVIEATVSEALNKGRADTIGLTKRRPKPIKYGGIQFSSHAECARHFGVHPSTFGYRLETGRDPITGEKLNMAP
jgi:hypothetical protein